MVQSIRKYDDHIKIVREPYYSIAQESAVNSMLQMWDEQAKVFVLRLLTYPKSVQQSILSLISLDKLSFDKFTDLNRLLDKVDATSELSEDPAYCSYMID